MAVPYTFGSATTSIPLSQLDSNFATTITLGNTAVQLGNTITNLTGVSNVASATSLSLGSNGNTTAVTIDTSQNVGIGITSPGFKLDIVGSAAQITNGTGASGSRVQINAPARSSGSYIQLYKDLTPSYVAGIGTALPGGSAASATIFSDYQGSWTERMRIDSSGNLLVGTTSQINNGTGITGSSSQTSGGVASGLTAVNTNASGDVSPPIAVVKTSTTTSSTARFIQFYANNTATAMGGIVGNGASNVQFAAISDAREKTNIQPISGSLNKILALKPSSFDWIATNEHNSAGFIAQEVQTVFPEFVVENMANEGDEQRYGLTGGMTGGIIPHLVKAIQEQQALITSLTARIEALEAK